MSKTQKNLLVEWDKINWRKLNRIVSKLQKRIYRAEKDKDMKTVHKLQKLLLKSKAAKFIAVRRVAQDSKGKKTAGIDGVKQLSSKDKAKLASILKVSNTAKPTKRVWIPKAGKNEKRPLGIPTIHDRALQALVKLSLEPQWEARFEPNNYGFRPGRSTWDAIQANFLAITAKPKYVLDADIASCFDRIDHQLLLGKLAAPTKIRRQIKAWLKSGALENDNYVPTDQGTPQGGVISPLLANIALHGLDDKIRTAFPETQKINGVRIKQWKPRVIRYADDFVILHQDLSVIEKCKTITAEWLKEIGLELKESKTSISHTLHPYKGRVGFDFLGFTIRQITVGPNQSGYSARHEPLCHKTLIQPSKESVKKHTLRMRSILKENRNAKQEKVIQLLNPVIRGWSNYFSTVASKSTYSKLDNIIFHQLKAWCNFRHSSKSSKWKAAKYWKQVGNHKWTFACQNKNGSLTQLFKHTQTKIARHVKVKGDRTPYDGDWKYWKNRKSCKSKSVRK